MSTIEPTLTIPDLVPTSKRRGPTRDINESLVIGVVLTALSYFVGLKVHWVHKLNWLEVFAVFTSYSCTWLCVKERRINYPIGAISSAAYALLFFQAHLVASAVLNAYLVPYLVVGWIWWRRDVDTRPVTRITLKTAPIYLGVAGAGYFVASLLSSHYHGTMAWTDALILAGSLLAQVMLDRKILDNWTVWAIVNVFAIYTYARTGLPLVAFQYVFFFLNCGIGAHAWRKSMRSVN